MFTVHYWFQQQQQQSVWDVSGCQFPDHAIWVVQVSLKESLLPYGWYRCSQMGPSSHMHVFVLTCRDNFSQRLVLIALSVVLLSFLLYYNYNTLLCWENLSRRHVKREIWMIHPGSNIGYKPSQHGRTIHFIHLNVSKKVLCIPDWGLFAWI